MIVVRITGGLGNQMFQYALGRRLAEERNCRLLLDITHLDRDPHRRYRLDRYQTRAEIASNEVISRFTSQDPRYLRHRRLRALGPLSWHDRVLVEQKEFTFDKNVISERGNLYLIGYWQQEKYFEPISNLLRREFRPASAVSPLSAEIADQMRKADSISLHVRHGDYSSDYHGILAVDYYRAAFDRLKESVSRPQLFIFSDDPDWVEENLRFDCERTIVRHNGEEREYEDLWLMTRCRHHIIANSSFSWWGAWLSQSENKIVIAPARWMQLATMDTSQVIPPDWIRI